MKRLVCFMLALSALGLLIFYGVAARSSVGADVVMSNVSIFFGILSIFAIMLSGKREMPTAAALLSAIFWFSIHPNPTGGVPALFFSCLVLAAAVYVAATLRDAYRENDAGFSPVHVPIRLAASVMLSLAGAILGQHIAYESQPGEPLWIGFAFEGAFFLLAFFVAPWRTEDFNRLFPRTARRRPTD